MAAGSVMAVPNIALVMVLLNVEADCVDVARSEDAQQRSACA